MTWYSKNSRIIVYIGNNGFSFWIFFGFFDKCTLFLCYFMSGHLTIKTMNVRDYVFFKYRTVE